MRQSYLLAEFQEVDNPVTVRCWLGVLLPAFFIGVTTVGGMGDGMVDFDS